MLRGMRRGMLGCAADAGGGDGGGIGQSRSRGRRTRNSVLPGSEAKVTEPPYCSTMRWTMPRPRPVPTPTALVV